MKTAILQVADQGPVESLIVMLRSVGYECYYPDGDRMKATLRHLGCDTVLDISSLIQNWGYEQPIPLPEAPVEMLNKCDLYVDIKAHRNGPKIWAEYPYLKNKTLWYRINGGQPEHVIKPDGMDCGDEANPPCPILTPNMWYADVGPWSHKAYACWPPFYRFDDYLLKHGRGSSSAPICLTHNLAGWGYGDLIDRVGKLGVVCYGARSPAGLLPHAQIPKLLSKAHCLVHLKSSDAPGYSLYEALAAGCPLVVSRRLIWRNRMQELFIPNETCLVFDRETHDSLTSVEVDSCEQEILLALRRLSDPEENKRIGMNGRNKLLSLMWSENKPEDAGTLAQFFQRNYL